MNPEGTHLWITQLLQPSLSQPSRHWDRAGCRAALRSSALFESRNEQFWLHLVGTAEEEFLVIPILAPFGVGFIRTISAVILPGVFVPNGF